MRTATVGGDFPEPFEDFIVIYDPEAGHPASRWKKLDPSWKNESADSKAWSEAYIRANYPGFVGTLGMSDDPASGTGFLGPLWEQPV